MKNSKAILQVPGTMKIISAEIPVPKEDEVLIKVEYVGICGSDVHGFESGPFIPPKDPNQEIGLGHECAGTVVAVGSRVRKFKPGDRVNIEPGVPCGHCRYCLEGKYNICPDVDFMATQPQLPRRINALSVSSGELYLQTARQYGHDGRGAGGACRSRDACRDAGRC